MKTLLALALVIFSSLAAADSILVYEAYRDSSTDYLPEFEVNKSLGRAWINVVEAEFNGDSSYYSDNRVKVEGLSYDIESKTIVYSNEEKTTVCAKIYNQRWVIDIGGSIHMTKDCSFSQKVIKVDVDNGFEILRKEMVQVYLNVK